MHFCSVGFSCEELGVMELSTSSLSALLQLVVGGPWPGNTWSCLWQRATALCEG